MDIGTLIGLAIVLFGVLGGFVMEGGHLDSLVEVSAAVIVVGGSFGATCIGFSLKNTTSLPIVMKQVFFEKQSDPFEMVQLIVGLAKKARQLGILALEADAHSIKNVFVRDAIQMVVDGTQPEMVRETLETELDAMRNRHKVGVEFFASWGGYCPTFGVLGTVMGLVHMLESLDDPGKMGPAIAVAFIATLYGVGVANMFLLPMSGKLKARSHSETNTYEMVIEGILSLQAGDNPRVVATRMRAYVPPAAKRKLDAQEA